MNPGELHAAPTPRADAVGSRLAPRILGIVLGAAVVAIAAQLSFRLPVTVVPLTLQPLAVLFVGGVLGATGGISALVLYLAAGVAGLPVFAGGSSGALHLLGPTGGYLLAFPVAAGVTGWLARRAAVESGWRAGLVTLLACVAGLVVIHAGGVAQLAILGGDPVAAFRIGFVPFFANDLIKAGLAVLLILALRPRLRALR